MPPPISIIIPALNEVNSIGQVVAEMPCTSSQRHRRRQRQHRTQPPPSPAQASARHHFTPRLRSSLSRRLQRRPPSSTILVTGRRRLPTSSPTPAPHNPHQKNEADFVIAPATAAHANPDPCSSSDLRRPPRSIFLRLLGKAATPTWALPRHPRNVTRTVQMSELTYGWNLEMQIQSRPKQPPHPGNPRRLPQAHRRHLQVSGDFKASIKGWRRILESSPRRFFAS